MYAIYLCVPTVTKTIDRSNILYHLGLLTRRWRQVLDAEFQTTGLTDAAWRPLLHLQILGDGILQKELAASIGIEGPSLVRLLDTLITKGLVQRSEDEQDRRAKRLCLTADGRLLVARIHDTVTALEHELLSSFNDNEIDQLAQLIQRLEPAVQAIRGRSKR